MTLKLDTKRWVAAVLGLITLSSSCSQMSFADEAPSELAGADYGTLFVVEQREKQVLPWQFGVNSSFEYGNPYANVRGTTLVVERSVHRFAWVGLQMTKYFSSSTSLMNRFGAELNIRDIQYSILNPSYSIYPIVTLVPLSGRMNLFGNHALQLELGIRMGVGSLFYSGDQGSRLGMMYSLRPTVLLSERWSVQLGVGHEVQSPLQSDSRIIRLRGDLGVSFSL